MNEAKKERVVVDKEYYEELLAQNKQLREERATLKGIAHQHAIMLDKCGEIIRLVKTLTADGNKFEIKISSEVATYLFYEATASFGKMVRTTLKTGLTAAGYKIGSKPAYLQEPENDEQKALYAEQKMKVIMEAVKCVPNFENIVAGILDLVPIIENNNNHLTDNQKNLLNDGKTNRPE